MSREKNTGVPDQLQQFKDEIASGTWEENARARAARRKSPWNLLMFALGLSLILICAYGLTFIGWLVHAQLNSAVGKQTFAQFMGTTIRISTFLLLVPSFLAAVAPACFLTNVLVYQIGPARRAMEREDKPFPSAGYEPSQVALRQAIKWSLVFWLICVLVAAAFP